jgi:alcohol dehydrogenase YqhD (iron-dependent ADH family)
MRNFVFNNPTKIIFGKGVEEKAGEEVAKYSKKILLHYGGGSIMRTGLYDTITSSLKNNGVEWVELSGVMPNPRLSLVKEGIILCREHQIGLILAVGGGSVIDSAKAIAAGTPYVGDVWDFFTGKAVVQEAIPVGTILTIPAAGSEASQSCVITNEDGWFKKAFDSKLVFPLFSFLNPGLVSTLPKFQMACGACDIMAHMLERYFTNTKSVELIDRMIEAGLKTVLHNIPKAIKNVDDYDALAELMWAGTIAHNTLLQTGRETDWASHMIEHELSAIYDIAHGAGLSIIFPAWMQYVYKHDIARFAQIAARVWNVDDNFFDPEWTALEGINRFKHFLKSIGLPVSLKEAGIDDNRLMEMADKATDGGAKTLGSFVKLNQQDVFEIYKLAL